MKYKLHIPFGSRIDLLRSAVELARDIGNIHLWANGIRCPRDIPMVATHEPGLVSIVSLMNICLQTSRDDDVAFFMHNDAEAKPGIAAKFRDFVQDAFKGTEKWGMAMTHYDVLCAVNMAAVRAVGGWDPMYFQYWADLDYYRTLRMAGWNELQSGLYDGVIHHNSQTVKSDALFRLRTTIREMSGIDAAYYACKWGGLLHQETFTRPFQNFNPDAPLNYDGTRYLNLPTPPPPPRRVRRRASPHIQLLAQRGPHQSGASIKA